jgi:hypothetical protein
MARPAIRIGARPPHIDLEAIRFDFALAVNTSALFASHHE